MAAVGRNPRPTAADSLGDQLTLADWERELARDAQRTVTATLAGDTATHAFGPSVAGRRVGGPLRELNHRRSGSSAGVRPKRNTKSRHSSRRANSSTATASTAKPTKTSPPLLATAGALLTRSHLLELGLTRTMADAVFRSVPAVVVFPGSSRPAIHVEDYLALLEASTYTDDRVRPT